MEQPGSLGLQTKCRHCQNSDVERLVIDQVRNGFIIHCLNCEQTDVASVFCHNCGIVEESQIRNLDDTSGRHARCNVCDVVLCFEQNCLECDPDGVMKDLNNCTCFGKREIKLAPAPQFVVKVCKGCNTTKRISSDRCDVIKKVCRLLNECVPEASLTCECGGIQQNDMKLGQVGSELFVECDLSCKQRLYIDSRGVQRKTKAKKWDKEAKNRKSAFKPGQKCQCGGIQRCEIKTGKVAGKKFVQCTSCNERLYLDSKGNVAKRIPGTGKKLSGQIGWPAGADTGCPCGCRTSRAESESKVVCKAMEEQRSYKHGHQIPRTIVNDIFTLKSGDHVAWKRNYIIWHHAIVIGVDYNSSTFTVAEYTGAPGNKKEFGAFARIEVTTYPLSKHTNLLYRVDYESCFSAVETVHRAHSRLGEQKYSIFELNCEDFARWCKTGVEWCTQRASAGAELKHRAAMIISGPVGEILESLLVSIWSVDIRRVGAIVSQVVKDISKTGGRTVGRRILGSAVGALGALLFEFALFVMDVKKAWRAYKDGRIEKAEFLNELGRSGCKHAGAVIGGVGLGLTGFLIPVPFLGTIVFGLIGRIIGAFLGGLIGSLICRRKDALP